MRSVFDCSRPVASVSFDLDDQWSYERTYGKNGTARARSSSYLDILIPYALNVFRILNLKVTVFVVGWDAQVKSNTDVLRTLSSSGHEIGNHSFHHEPWLHTFSKNRIEQEIKGTEECIIKVFGEKPVGFRGPGFSICGEAIRVLSRNGYLYDTSTLPTFLGPILRGYYFRNSTLNAEEKKRRNSILQAKDGKRPVKPYLWKVDSEVELLEIPVTTIPVFKTPFHMSYLLFLGRISVVLMLCYLRLAVIMCRATGTEPTFVIHPTDLLDADQVRGMGFFPGMEISAGCKLGMLKMVIRYLSRYFDLVDMRSHAKVILERGRLKRMYIGR
jgi:hypothetical protein